MASLENPIRWFRTRQLLDLWDYQAVVVTPELIDRAFQRGGLRIGNRTYTYSSDSIFYIVLDLEGASPLRRSLKVFSQLEYPLASAFEAFHTMAEERQVMFARNASNVTIEVARRRIIFVHPTTSTNTIKIGDVEFNVHHDMGAQNAPPDIQWRAFDAALSNCVLDCLTNGAPLRREWNDMVKLVNGGRDLDWSVISEMLVHILPRFPPQAEQSRTGGVGEVPFAANNLNARAYFFNTNPNGPVAPADLALGDHLKYHHPDMVTAADVVMANRQDADAWPVLRVGARSSAAELFVGLGFFLIETPTSRSTMEFAVMESIRSILFKARSLRCYVEIVKNTSGLATAIAGIADTNAAIDKGKWQTEVAASTKSFTNLMNNTLYGGHEKLGYVYSYTINTVRHGFQATLTGCRVPALADLRGYTPVR